MCFFKSSNDAARIAAESDARMKREEEERQARIKEGQGAIDTAFGQFDDNFFGGYQDAYKGNYLPQIGDQYAEARDKLTAILAGRGTLESTVGAHALGKLDKEKGAAEAQIGAQGADAANALRSQVENTKSNLYNLNTSAGDPSLISAQAIGQATTLKAPQAYSPLGQVFASALQPFINYSKVDSTSLNPKLPWNQFASAPTSGSGNAVYG